MTQSPVRLPAGVRDFLPRAAARRRAIGDRLLALFERWGYQRIITPVFECADVLERGLGEQGREEAIRFVEPGTGEIVALRPDFTPQVARLAATRLLDQPGPWRLSYEGAVHRLSGPRGQREILQAGVELIGAEPPAGDAEMLALAAAVLATFDGVVDVRLEVGHVAPARAVLAAAPSEDAREKLTDALAKKDRAGVARAAASLPSEWRPLAEALPRLWGPAARVLAEARALAWSAPVAAAIDDLAATLEATRELVDPELHAGIAVDLGEVRGFEYYTGLRLAGFARGAGDAVLRGGRYDELVGRYGKAAHAIGFAVDIEAIAGAQRAADVAPPPSTIVLVRGEGAARIASELRTGGVRAAVDFAPQIAAGPPDLAAAKNAGFARIVTVAGELATIVTVEGGATEKVAVADLHRRL